MDRTVKLVVDGVVDVTAIAGLVWLIYAGTLEPVLGVGAIVTLAGGQLGARIVAARTPGSPGTSLRPPPAALLALIAAARLLVLLMVIGGMAR